MPLITMFAYLFAIYVITKSKRRVRTFLLIIGQTLGLILAAAIILVIYGTLTHTASAVGRFSGLVLPLALFGSSSIQLRAIRRIGSLPREDVWFV
jgi:hypothetical protein